MLISNRPSADQRTLGTKGVLYDFLPTILDDALNHTMDDDSKYSEPLNCSSCRAKILDEAHEFGVVTISIGDAIYLVKNLANIAYA